MRGVPHVGDGAPVAPQAPSFGHNEARTEHKTQTKHFPDYCWSGLMVVLVVEESLGSFIVEDGTKRFSRRHRLSQYFNN